MCRIVLNGNIILIFTERKQKNKYPKFFNCTLHIHSAKMYTFKHISKYLIADLFKNTF